MTMKITAVSVRNFKRIREITIEPGERHVVLIGGKNAQGKSSLLDAFTAALGGKKQTPADAVHHGADAAEIRVEFDGGAMTARRVIKPDGDSTLVVTEDGVPVRSPQELLNVLVGARFLDPLKFLAKEAGDQRATLLALIDRDGAIAEIDRERRALYDERTEVGRSLRRAEGELARLPEVLVGQTVDLGDLSAQLTAEMEAGNQAFAAQAALEAARGEYKAADADVKRLTAELAAANVRLAAARDAGDKAAKVRKALPDAATLQDRIERAKASLSKGTQINAEAAGAAAARERRQRAADDVERTRAERDRLTGEIERLDTAKAARLAAAALPVPGLDFDGEGITLNGAPFANASGAERLRVALGLAVAASSKLGDVWIRDGALLDEDSLALVAELAERAGIRVWIERVGAGDPGAIVIHDGGLK